MACNGFSTYVEWTWQSNLNPFSPDEIKEWRSYSEEDCGIIEEACMNGERFAYLANYSIDLKHRVQILNKDPTKIRPVKREEHNKESWLERTKKLGAGCFGTVYKGIYRGSQEVAYKVTKTQLSQEAMRETNIIKTLHHPSIVRYIDVIHASRHTLLVMELIDGGTVYEYIRQTPYSSDYWRNTQSMMLDVAYAMCYLHEKKVVHADLKCDNILLRSNGKAVLSDFGLSMIIEDSKMQHGYTGKGAVRWRSPKLYSSRRERCSFSSDVWAYGCVLLEIITKKFPWEEKYRHNADLVDALCDEGNAVIFQEICFQQKAPVNFRKILCACCTWSKYNRPSFTKIIQDLHHTSNTDHELRNVASNKTGMSHFQQQSSAQNSPTPSNRQLHVQNLNGVLYDSDDNEDDISHSSSQAYSSTQAAFPEESSSDTYSPYENYSEKF